MKDFKIDIFNEKKITAEWENYSVKKIKEIKYYGSIENLILELDRFKEKEIIITQGFRVSDIIQEYESSGEENIDPLSLIREDGKIYNERDARNISGIKDKDFKNFDYEIYINYLSEQLYKKLDSIGVEIVAFSGLYEEQGDDSNPEDIVKFNFIINIDDRKRFISGCIRAIEDEYDSIHDKKIINELKKEQIGEIIQLNKKNNRKSKLIKLKNNNNSKEFELILLLLHLEGQIYIRPAMILNGFWEVDLLTSKDKVYFLNHIEYNITSGIFINRNNKSKYEVKKLYRLFLSILIEENKRVIKEKIYEYFKGNIGKNDFPASNMDSIKGNLLKLLRKNDILLKNEDFIKGGKGGYIIEFSYN